MKTFTLEVSYYVYRITNILENKHYYGFRQTKINPKFDLGIKYFSSSKDKIFLNDQKVNRKNYKYKIIKIFNNKDDALNLEIKLHSKFNVAKNNSFYNKSNQTNTGFMYGMFGKQQSERQKENSKLRMLGKNNPMFNIGDKHPLKLNGGHSEETKKKISEKRKSLNIKYSDDYKLKMSNTCKERQINVGEKNGMYGTHLIDKQKDHLRNITLGLKRSNETKEKMKQSAINRKDYPIVCCNICGKEGKLNAMNRWHFDNCKFKKGE